MLKTLQRIKYYKNDAIILNFTEDEVLLFIREGYIKWVDKDLVEVMDIR